MTAPGLTAPGLTAAHVAVALVAAAKITGADASRVFEDGAGHRRTRIMAAAGIAARVAGCSRRGVAPLLKVCGPELSPSMLVRAEITTDHLTVVGEALHVHGLTGPSEPRTFDAAETPVPSSPRANPVRPSVARPSRLERTVRIKPVTDRIVSWAGWFLEAGNWTSEEVADLFDVDPEALLTALEADGVCA